MDNFLKKAAIITAIILAVSLLLRATVCAPATDKNSGKNDSSHSSKHKSISGNPDDDLDENFDPYADDSNQAESFDKGSFVFADFSSDIDSELAIIKSIALTPQSIMGKGWVRIKIETTVDGSHIQYIAARLASPSYLSGMSGQSMYRSLRGNSEQKIWRGAFAIRSFHEAGQWQITTIYVKMNSGKYYAYTINSDVSKTNYVIGTSPDAIDSGLPIHPGVKIIETATDKTPPVIHSITMTPGSIDGPGSVKIIVKATDDGSGIESISAYLHSPALQSSGQGHKMFLYFSKNENTGTWEDSCVFRSYHESGTWKIMSIVACDKANNCNLYKMKDSVSTSVYAKGYADKLEESDVPVAGVTVNGTSGDTEPPVLNNIFVSPYTIYGSGVITVTLDVTETGSGIRYARATLANTAIGEGNQVDDKYIAFDYNSDTNTWKGSVSLDSGNKSGLWKITNISLQDFAGNSNTYLINSRISNNNYTRASENGASDSGVPIAPGVKKN